MANYAQNALWWALKDADVRALAAILTAPPLWDCGCELPVRELLGEQGFRFLLALDNEPQPLHRYLNQHQPFAHRLGFYAEHLLVFWFVHAPHCRLLAHNLTVADSGSTLGALDFVVQIHRQIYHVELACKYYVGNDSRPESLAGLNPQDTFSRKQAKLSQQLALSATPAGKRALQVLLKTEAEVRVAGVVRGMGFGNDADLWWQPPLNPYGWFGTVVEKIAEWLPEDSQTVLHRIHPMKLLAPARVAENECHTLEQIAADLPAYVAVVARREDGFWHEVSRIAVIG